jgi:hypothetical protein
MFLRLNHHHLTFLNLRENVISYCFKNRIRIYKSNEYLVFISHTYY